MDPAPSAPSSKKRAHSPDSPVVERPSRSDIENNEVRERKDKKKRRKRQRKISVVEERDAGPKPLSASSSRASFARSITLDDVSAPPRATEKQPEFVQGSSSSATPAQDVVALKETVDTQKKSLDAHGALLGLMLPSLTCQICLDLLHKPFVLAPCGHMACYTCLVSWFTTPPANDNVHELAQFRKKTCPHCRAVVRERPAEVWAIKEMVANISRSGLAPHFPPAPVAADEPVAAPVLPGQVAAVRDAWANIFPAPPRAGMPIPGLGAGGAEVAAMGMYDAEDAVYRCLDCMHEIWEGSCAQCGRIYPGHDDLDIDVDLDGDEDVANIYAALHAGHVDGFHPAQAFYTEPIISDDSDGEGRSDDEGSYEGSFIDDDDDDAPPPPGMRGRRGGSVIELSSDSDGEAPVRALGRGWRVGRGPAPGPIVISDDEAGSDSDEGVVGTLRRNGRMIRGRSRVMSEDEAEDEENGRSDHSSLRMSDRELQRIADAIEERRAAHPEGYESHGELSGGEDDEEDDGALRGPSRRLQRLMAQGGSDEEEELYGAGESDVDEDGAIRGPSRRLMGVMQEDEDFHRYGGGSDDERYGGSDEEGDDGGYPEFEVDY